MNRPQVTLCMIVKDETHIIEQCLRSMAKYVDRYDITDTGSTDGTQDLIKKTMDELGIPGEVHQSDWKGFGDHGGKMGSRTESFRNAEKNGADYAWVIDADDFIEGDFKYPEKMDADGYGLKMGRADFSWWRNQIFKLEANWRYIGILHEYADCDDRANKRFEQIDGNYRVVARTEGNRNIGISPIDKYKKDAETLLGALKDEPKNERYHFYLAQSYFDSQQWEKALEAYQNRIELGGWPEEVYYSRLRCGIVKGMLQESVPVVAQAFLEAYAERPTRAEPLWFLSRLYRMNNMPGIAYIYARQAAEIPYPKGDILFIQDDVYQWGILDEIGATAYYANQPLVGHQACKKLVDNNLFPIEHRDRVHNNYKSYNQLIEQLKGDQESRHIQEELKRFEEKEKERKVKREKLKAKIESGKKGTKMPSKAGYKKKKTKQKV